MQTMNTVQRYIKQKKKINNLLETNCNSCFDSLFYCDDYLDRYLFNKNLDNKKSKENTIKSFVEEIHKAITKEIDNICDNFH